MNICQKCLVYIVYTIIRLFQLTFSYFHFKGGILNWMIINKDKFPSSNNNKGRQFRCLNCQEKGHLARNCPRPPSKKRCYMCGIEGHLEPKCPNKMCLRVSFATKYFSQTHYINLKSFSQSNRKIVC